MAERWFVDLGGRVALVMGSRRDTGAAIALRLTGLGARVHTSAELGDTEGAWCSFDTVWERSGGLDILVHDVQDVSHVDRLVSLSREFARRTQSPRGRIIMVWSSSLPPALASNVEALTRSLAQELMPRRITVNMVAPTPRAGAASGACAHHEPAIRRLTLGSGKTPGDIADVVCYLASDAAAWMTGQIITAQEKQLSVAHPLRH